MSACTAFIPAFQLQLVQFVHICSASTCINIAESTKYFSIKIVRRQAKFHRPAFALRALFDQILAVSLEQDCMCKETFSSVICDICAGMLSVVLDRALDAAHCSLAEIGSDMSACVRTLFLCTMQIDGAITHTLVLKALEMSLFEHRSAPAFMQ